MPILNYNFRTTYPRTWYVLQFTAVIFLTRSMVERRNVMVLFLGVLRGSIF